MKYIKCLSLSACLIAFKLSAFSMDPLGSEAEKNPQPIVEKPYKVIGKLEGVLAPFFENDLFNSDKQVSNILLASQGIKGVNDTEFKMIRKSYDEGFIIACLHPAENAIEHLLNSLEPSVSHPAESAGVEFYAYRKSLSGGRQATFLAPSPEFTNLEIDQSQISEDLLKILQDNIPSFEDSSSKDDFDEEHERCAQRAKQILEWFKKENSIDLYSTGKVTSSSPFKISRMSDAGAVINLYDLTENFADFWQVPIELGFKPGWWNRKYVVGTPKITAYFQIVSFIRAISIPFKEGIDGTKHEKDDYTSIIYLVMQPSLYPGSIIMKHKKIDSSVWGDDFSKKDDPVPSEFPVTMEYFNIMAIPGKLKEDKSEPDYDNNYFNNDVILLSQVSPDTTSSATEYSSSISMELGGSVGFFGSEAITGDINASFNISHSETRSIYDVTIKNNSYSSPSHNDATWNFNLSNESARTTFEPLVQAVWRLHSSYLPSMKGQPAQRIKSIPISLILDGKAKNLAVNLKGSWGGANIPSASEIARNLMFSYRREIQVNLPPSPEDY